MKKVIFTIICIGLLFFAEQLAFDSSNRADYSVKNVTFEKVTPSDNVEVLSIENMKMITGGCGGGGTCTYYFHSCASGCTYMEIYTCIGSTGNCINSNYDVSCACIGYYDREPDCS